MFAKLTTAQQKRKDAGLVLRRVHLSIVAHGTETAICFGGLCGQRFLGSAYDDIESRRIGDRDFGQRFTIKLNVRLFETVDQLAVPNAAHATSGIDPCDPQSTEISLSYFTIAVSINATADQRFFDGSQQTAASAAKTFCPFEEAFFCSIASSTLGCSHRFPFSSSGPGMTPVFPAHVLEMPPVSEPIQTSDDATFRAFGIECYFNNGLLVAVLT
jgi:hypothetical protein